MQKELVRLECLKLAHRHDRTPAAVVEVAKIYESYILSDTKADNSSAEASEVVAPALKAGAASKKKKADNSILD